MGKLIFIVVLVAGGVGVASLVWDASKRASLEIGQACEKHVHCVSGTCLVFENRTMCAQMCSDGFVNVNNIFPKPVVVNCFLLFIYGAIHVFHRDGNP